MATGITERNKLKQELAGLGYSLKYIDEWAPKTRLYRHKASYNVEGEVMDEVGTNIDNVPGNPDYVQRKAKIGLFTWKPGPECSCKWCAEGFKSIENKSDKVSESCNLCDFSASAVNKLGLSSKMRAHARKVHK